MLDGSSEDDPDHSALIIKVEQRDSKLFILVEENDQIQFIQFGSSCDQAKHSNLYSNLISTEPSTLIDWAVIILNTSDATLKVSRTLKVAELWNSGKLTEIGQSLNVDGTPPRDPQIQFTKPTKAGKRGNAGTMESKIAILHALANIEQWAIDLGWDIIVRFAQNLPHQFSTDFVKLASDEARHFTLLENRLKDFGSYFGALKVHGSLWESAIETKDDVLARLAVVHMVHEGRGLDVNPKTIEKFRKVSDFETAQKLEIIHSVSF